MAQITIYMDDETAEQARSAAKSAGVSLSAWMAGLVKEKTRSSWPADVRAAFGSWTDADLGDAAELRASLGEDVPRESL